MSQERDDAYRAIGRYVTEFSQLIRVMRVAVAEYVADDPAQMDIPEMMLGDQPAQSITNVFFGVCREVGNLDVHENKVWSRLRQEVSEITEERNNYAHGDWIVGEAGFTLPATLPATFLALDPKLLRIRAARAEGPRKMLTVAVADLDAKTDNLLRVLRRVHEFGRLALGLPVRHDHDGKQVMSRGEYRVRDVLVIEGGGKKKAGKARVESNGPRTSELIWDYGY